MEILDGRGTWGEPRGDMGHPRPVPAVIVSMLGGYTAKKDGARGGDRQSKRVPKPRVANGPGQLPPGLSAVSICVFLFQKGTHWDRKTANKESDSRSIAH